MYGPSNIADRRQNSQDFYQLRDSCLRRNVLFEDPEFPATSSSVFYSKSLERKFEWKRPHQIARNPQFFVDGFSRFDIEQGDLGDCWLLAAMTNLTLNRYLFFQVVPQNQNFKDYYAGIFHFRFWQYGKWVDIVIDDQLPTHHGQLTFLRGVEPNEFWCPLFEKAYAKLNGSYEAIQGGYVIEAMQDFTGGVAETYDLHKPPPNLFNTMVEAYKRNSLMGCCMEHNPYVCEQVTHEGLVRGHAYGITQARYVTVKHQNNVTKIPLVRIRNPWGNEAEWNGPWSDKSREWQYLSEAEKEKINLHFNVDGEFWMAYSDFQKNFDVLEICNLSPDSTIDANTEILKNNWQMHKFDGEWVSGVNAGGCGNYRDTFWHNPQYRITLNEADEGDDENKCTIIVALMQKYRRALRKTGLDFLHIGFAVYHIRNPARLRGFLNFKFFKYNASVAYSEYINLREVTCRFRLPRGTYCIIPSTYEPNQNAKFLLRVFSEHKHDMEFYQK